MQVHVGTSTAVFGCPRFVLKATPVGGTRSAEPETPADALRCARRRPEPGGDQQGTEFAAVQGDGMGLVVHSWPAHVRGRRGAEEFFLDRVPVEPGDGGQPPGDRGAGTALRFEVPGRALDVGAADGEQGQGPGAAPAGELAQVQRVGLAGQAAVAGQEPGEGDSLSVGEDGLDRGERGGWGRQGSSGTSRPGRNREGRACHHRRPAWDGKQATPGSVDRGAGLARARGEG